MAARISPERRQAIAADLLATFGTPEGTVGKICKRHGVARATVDRIKREQGLKGDQSTPEHSARTKNAIEARQALVTQQRAQVSDNWLTLATMIQTKLLEALGARPADVSRETSANGNDWLQITITSPSEIRAMVNAAAVAMQSHALLERIDGDSLNPALVDQFNEHMLSAGDD